MNKLEASELASFTRRYTFAGGRVRRVVIRTGKATTVELRLAVKAAVPSLGDAAKWVRLRVVFDGVEEYRFQKRPAAAGGRITHALFGSFDGLIYLNLDAYRLDPGERPALPDFRASDAFVAGADVRWEEMGSRTDQAPREEPRTK
jgi:hypothetical protein